MPTYKLTYFDGRGRGEITRYVFHAASEAFEDIRVKSEDWPALKSTTPFGQLPFLNEDGRILAQSAAIARYLARQFGLGGKDNWEQALIDQYMGLADDLYKVIVQWLFEKDEKKKCELKSDLDDFILPKFCGMFEKALEQNEGKFFVGDSMTLADLVVLDIFDTPESHNPKVLDSFPKLKAHRERISSTPNLASYIKDREETPF